MRLIDHLRATGLSSGQARTHMKTGKVLYRGIPTADGGREVAPEQVTVDMSARRVRVGADPTVVWSDAHMAVVWKPPGLLSCAAPRRGGEANLISLMGRRLGAVYLVHRLDEPTSGLMMVARTAVAQTALKDLLAEHNIERQYVAFVSGRFPAGVQTVDASLVRDRGDRRRGVGDGPDAVHARSQFRLGAHLGKHASLVEARLHTGRTHQVRIHLAHLGYPVLGDRLYAPRRVTSAAARLALHAWRLGLTHPMTGEALAFEAPLPDDMEQLRRRLIQR